ncbi:receptor-type tyrosine-protein phosphatase gamma-like isoform 2-T2 [Spinachia spinachia]
MCPSTSAVIIPHSWCSLMPPGRDPRAPPPHTPLPPSRGNIRLPHTPTTWAGEPFALADSNAFLQRTPGIYGPDGWAPAYPECKERNQSPINIVDQDTKVSTEFQELTLEGFDAESSNKTSMKNTGKTVAIVLKDDYFVRGAGLPGRFKAENVEFHWGLNNGSAGSEHSINGRRYPVEMQIYMYNSDDFDSLSAALRERRIIAAMAVFFKVGTKDNPAVDPIIHGLKGVVHHEKETVLEPFVLKDLLPSAVGSYYRYTGSLTTPPCSKVVEWILFSRPISVSYKQLEAFYSIFTTEQQDHVKSVEYLRSNFRPVQSLDNRHVFKSAVKDAWLPDLTDRGSGPYGTEASKVCSSAPINMKVKHVNSSTLVVRWARPEVTYHPPILNFLVSYSWTTHDDSYEETHLADAKHKLEAVIAHVSPDVLYLFRVQAICMNDMRSDFSQSMLFRANTTRIFEGTRIVKTGMPTVSPASSADMAPISSGSSTWTSSGIPFSFVSIATGIGPSSSGSQATVASLVTSTLLAGLGFSSGVLSSFPSSVWSSRPPTHDGNSARQTTEPADATTSAVARATTKDNGDAGGKDREKSKGQGEEEEKEYEEKDEEEEEEEEEEKKRKRKTSGRHGRTRREENTTPKNEPSSETPDATAKEKKATEPDTENQLGVYSHNPLYNKSPTSTEPGDATAEFPVPKDTTVTLDPSSGRDKHVWPFYIHIDHPSAVTNLTRRERLRSEAGPDHVKWLVPLVVVSGLTFLCLVLLLAVLVYWRKALPSSPGKLSSLPPSRCLAVPLSPALSSSQRQHAAASIHCLFTRMNTFCFLLCIKYRRCFQTAHFYVEDNNSLRVVPNEAIPAIHIADDMEAIPVNQFIKRIAELYSNNQQGFSEDFEEVQRYTTDMKITSEHSNHPDNKHKNRYINIVAYDHRRVKLMPLAGKDSKHTDYINANYVDGYNKPKAYTAAQGPLKSTFEDFWRMVCEQIICVIVTITNLVEKGTAEDECMYWPCQEEAMICEAFTVTLISKDQLCLSNEEQLSIQDFILEATQDDYVLEVRHLLCPNWPKPNTPIGSTFELINIIKEETAARDGPTVAHDELGAMSAGTPCALTILSRQLENEGAADVYQVAKMMNLMRPVVFTDIDQYLYLYKALLSLVSPRETGSYFLSRDTNGTMSMSEQSDQADNMESLV